MANLGKIITTIPLKSMDEIQSVKNALTNDPRALAMFTIAINTGLRSCDLLSLKRSGLKGNELFIRERKTKKLRRLIINEPTLKVINSYLATRTDNIDLLFIGARGKITHGTYGKWVKSWCDMAGLDTENRAGHTLRKTFVRTNYERGVKLATLMVMCNHSSERQTLTYIGITGEDVQKVYEHAI